MKQLITSLTFQDGRAEEAMNFYVELFDNSEVLSITRWGENMPVDVGKIMQARFDINGHAFMCSDSPAIHEWGFTPAVSNYLECEDETELMRLFTALSKSGTVTMPPDHYGFSQQFAWVVDQFGVSWQLNVDN